MKNIIKYYYGLDVTNIIYKEGYYKMIINKNNYLLCPASKKDLLSIESYLVNNYNFHEIIPTLNNDITIFMNNGEYVLLKLTSIYKRISLDDILSFNYPIYSKSNSREKWISLWSDHIDYIEYQINELSNKYPTLSKYIYYYIGLAENAIELLILH